MELRKKIEYLEKENEEMKIIIEELLKKDNGEMMLKKEEIMKKKSRNV